MGAFARVGILGWRAQRGDPRGAKQWGKPSLCVVFVKAQKELEKQKENQSWHLQEQMFVDCERVLIEHLDECPSTGICCGLHRWTFVKIVYFITYNVNEEL